jgi:Uncharacterized protein conserved in bacteria
MPKLDADEQELINTYEAGELISVASKDDLARYRDAARATGLKDKRVNVRLSSGDLRDLQVRALAEGVPYQTLITSVLHKFVTGRLAERAAPESAAPDAS